MVLIFSCVDMNGFDILMCRHEWMVFVVIDVDQFIPLIWYFEGCLVCSIQRVLPKVGENSFEENGY